MGNLLPIFLSFMPFAIMRIYLPLLIAFLNAHNLIFPCFNSKFKDYMIYNFKILMFILK